MKKTILFLAMIAIVSISLISCSRQGNNLTGIETIPSTNISIQPVENGSRDEIYMILPGDTIVVRGELLVINPADQEPFLLDDTGDKNNYVVLGVMEENHSISDYVTTALIRQNEGNGYYSIAYSAITPAGREYPLNLTFEAVLSSEQDTTIVSLDMIYQAQGPELGHGHRQYYGYFVGFTVDGNTNNWTISPYGTHFIDDLMDMTVSWDGIADSTANEEGTGLMPIPDSLYAQDQYLGGPDANITLRSSYSNDNPLPMDWSEDNQRHEVIVRVLPDCHYNLKVIDADTYDPKYCGIEATTDFGSTELINFYDYDGGSGIWNRMLVQIINGIPVNVEWFDHRLYGELEFNPDEG